MAELPENADTNEATEAQKLLRFTSKANSPRPIVPRSSSISTTIRSTASFLKEAGRHAARIFARPSTRIRDPGEVAEAFKGHMERAMLLDDVHGADPIVRINHRPQMALAAAIVLLAAGLGVFVYKILPRPIQNYSTAPATPTTLPESIAVATPAHTVEVTREPDARDIAAAPAAPVSPVASAVPAGAPVDTPPPAAITLSEPAKSQAYDGRMLGEQKGSFALAGQSLADTSLFRNEKAPALDRARLLQLDSLTGSMDRTTSERLEKSGLIANPASTVCLVVRSDDPVLARKQVRSYFATNKIPFEVLDESNRLPFEDNLRRRR